MNFNINRHIRLAGSVTVLVGFYLSNWTVVLLGNVVVAIGYMLSVVKMERAFEKLNDIKIGTEDK